MAGDDLDEIASAVGELRRDTKLADEDDFAAFKVDRQHGDGRSGAQQVARFDTLARALRAQPLVRAKSAGENLALDDRRVGGFIGKSGVDWNIGNGHRSAGERAPNSCAPSLHPNSGLPEFGI